MKKIILTLIFFLFSLNLTAQLEDRFGYLLEKDLKNFVQPFATSLGVGFNSGLFHNAYVSKSFGFSLSLKGMLILIPDDELSFTPEGLPNGYEATKTTSTIYGGAGSNYDGPLGYLSYPSGINVDQVPLIFPQISFSFMGTELLFRYLPEIQAGDEKVKMLGIGLKHNFSQYIPFVPVSFAVQGIYQTFSLSNIVEINNLAFNVQASRQFGIALLYGGLQYEKTNLDFEYTYTDPNGINPELDGNLIKLSSEGENNFRLIVGGALKLAFFVLNADFGLGKQNVATVGLTFEF